MPPGSGCGRGSSSREPRASPGAATRIRAGRSPPGSTSFTSRMRRAFACRASSGPAGHELARTRLAPPDCRSGDRLRAMPAAARVLPARGAREEARVPGPGLLGPAGARVRRSARAPHGCGPGAGRARREPDRTRLHRRLERELALRGAPSLRLLESGDIYGTRRRARAPGLLRDRGGPLRPAGEQAVACRARPVPALPRGRDPAALAGARGRDPRPDRSRALAARGGVVGEAPVPESPGLRARRRVHPSRRDEARLLVSPEPPEHQHRPPHSADVALGVRSGPRLGEAAVTRHPGNRPLRRGAVAPAPAAARPAAEVQPWAENAAGAEGPSPRESAAARQALWVGLLLATAVSLAYAPIVRNDFVSYDDPPLIVENPIVNGGLSPGTLARAWTTFYRSNWMPLTWHSHQVVWALAGKTPLAHHLVNLALHVLNVLLVFWLARRITGLLRWTALWPAGLAGALFGLHPLHVESVAWAAERKDVLSTAFWLLTCHAYLTYARRPGAARYALVAVLFALGLTAKPMLVTLPLALLLLDWWPLGRLRFGRAARSAGEPAARPWLEKIPLLVLSAGSSVVTYLAQKSGGAVASTNAYSIGSRVANAITSYATYLYKYVAPSGLAVFVPRPPAGPPGVAVLVSAVALGAITWLAWSRREREPWLLMGWLWYLGTLVPVIGLLQVGEQALAWRYTYVPMIGIDLALVLSLASLSGVRSSEKRIARARGGPLRPIPVAAGSGAILLALAAATSAQVMVWKDSETLYRFALRVTDRNHVALNNLSAIYLVAGRKQEALPLFKQAVGTQRE